MTSFTGREKMAEETFLRLQQSEGTVYQAASRLLAAFIMSGQLKPDNEDELIGRSLSMVTKLALKADHAIESDEESGDK